MGGHILLFLLFSTYMRAIFARHKKIPNRFKLTNTPVDSPPNDEVSDVDNIVSMFA